MVFHTLNTFPAPFIRIAALVTEKFLRRQQTDSAFEDFYKAIVSQSENLVDGPVLPRQDKIPCKIMIEALHTIPPLH